MPASRSMNTSRIAPSLWPPASLIFTPIRAALFTRRSSTLIEFSLGLPQTNAAARRIDPRRSTTVAGLRAAAERAMRGSATVVGATGTQGGVGRERMSDKIRGLRWWMIGLVMLGAVLNYLIRSTLGFAAPTV